MLPLEEDDPPELDNEPLDEELDDELELLEEEPLPPLEEDDPPELDEEEPEGIH